MELSVGMYVRTKDGKIAKFIKYDEKDKEELVTDYYEYSTIWIKDVIKASHNIIDLIEVGDYVNDEKIVDIGCLTNGPERGTKIIDYYIAPNTVYYFKNEDIKSIVTKQQFLQMEYKVGE